MLPQFRMPLSMVSKIQNLCGGGNDSLGLQPACHRRADLSAFLDQGFGGLQDEQESGDCWRAAVLHFTPAQDLAKDLAGVPQLHK